MHLIVTHDNADFDAIASLVGAARLYTGAVPLLPPRLNRNVRDFLHLYRDEFPFLSNQELPDGQVDRLTLVDTQHPPPLKGVDENTQLQVIDHHSPSPSLPPDAIIRFQDTGAVTTMVVEEIQRQNIRLSPCHATLMLLGIYEDTGSLAYPNTTARDAYAAAWLLEHDASLEVLRQFLHYPLNRSQRILYEKLTEALETHRIQGHTVIISAAEADGYVEEISSLAHKLRSLFEPDALFLLVAMDDHVQVVARSTNDAIDVGLICNLLGGGGHTRAAAALIHKSDLTRVHTSLLEILSKDVRPATTVGQIMSHGVRTLTPTDTVTKAAEMMARYGHEGFPVVENGHIAGVLTRRQIDKAMHHKLGGVAIHQLMHVGEFFVTPHDSVETLQRLMTREGLGQVPVVEKAENENGYSIIGIVTRTDLINLWKEVPRPPRAEEIAAQLTTTISPPLLHLLREAGTVAEEQGDSLFIVGGFVRDLMLNYLELSPDRARAESNAHHPDIDLVVEGDAIKLAHRLAERYGGQVRSHQRFGTAKWLIDLNHELLLDQPRFDGRMDAAPPLPASLDFVTARTEFYEHPSALPQVEQSSIRQDLHRRDFTINTLAVRLSPSHYGELLDFYGGEKDLKQGTIRVLHSLSFVEDPTRMLRAARLEQRLRFLIESRTEELLYDALDLLDRVSGERIYHELHLIFREPQPWHALHRLDQLGVLRQIHPDLYGDEWFIERLTTLFTGLEGSAWSAMEIEDVHCLGLLTYRMPNHQAVNELCHRLRIRTTDAAILRQLHTLRTSVLPLLQQPLPPSRLFSLLSVFAPDSLLIAWIACPDDDQVIRAQLTLYQEDLRDVTPIIDGHYLQRELNLRPGPLFRRILDHLRTARLDGQVETLEDERAYVEKWLRQTTAE